MVTKRIFLEIGSGNDLHGGDYTKAAIRAVEDATHHSSLALFRSLQIDPKTMRVEVTIGVQRPESIELAAIKAVFPFGHVEVNVVQGGLDVPDEDGHDATVIASAAVVVRLDAAQLGR